MSRYLHQQESHQLSLIQVIIITISSSKIICSWPFISIFIKPDPFDGSVEVGASVVGDGVVGNSVVGDAVVWDGVVGFVGSVVVAGVSVVVGASVAVGTFEAVVSVEADVSDIVGAVVSGADVVGAAVDEVVGASKPVMH